MPLNLLRLSKSFCVAGEVVRTKPLQDRANQVCVSLSNLPISLYGVDLAGEEGGLSHVMWSSSLPKGDAFLIVCNPLQVANDDNTGVEIQRGVAVFPLPKDSDTQTELLTHCAMA